MYIVERSKQYWLLAVARDNQWARYLNVLVYIVMAVVFVYIAHTGVYTFIPFFVLRSSDIRTMVLYDMSNNVVFMPSTDDFLAWIWIRNTDDKNNIVWST